MCLLVFTQYCFSKSHGLSQANRCENRIKREIANQGYSRSCILGSLKSWRWTAYRHIITLASSLKNPKNSHWKRWKLPFSTTPLSFDASYPGNLHSHKSYTARVIVLRFLPLIVRIYLRAGNGSLKLTHDPLTYLICDPWPIRYDPWPITFNVGNVDKHRTETPNALYMWTITAWAQHTSQTISILVLCTLRNSLLSSCEFSVSFDSGCQAYSTACNTLM